MTIEHYSLKFTPQEMQILAEGLTSLPYKIVAPLMAKVQQQVSEQEAADTVKVSDILPD